MLLKLYLVIAAVSAPLWRKGLNRRIARGKEDPARMTEKMGHTEVTRPDGKLFWFHALSVGESLALLTLLRRLGQEMPDAHFLLTTTTVTSVRALENVGLPPRVIHQYLPADARGPVERFLDHWRPDLVAFAELDLWPYMLTRVAQAGIPLVLLNARITDRTFPKKQKAIGLYRPVIRLFSRILVQDAVSQDRFVALGADGDRVERTGSLKNAADPLPKFDEEFAALQTAIAGRPLWLAASTMIREEPQLFDAHVQARTACPDLLMIIAPRHVNVADETEALAKAKFTHVARRSRGEPISPQTEVYIADTFGEMGLWCRLAPVVFVGHSLPVGAPALAGKNPMEALAVGAMVLHGPDFADFYDVYERLLAQEATRQVQNSTELSEDIVRAVGTEAFRTPYLNAAASCMAEDQAALDRTAEVVRKSLGP